MTQKAQAIVMKHDPILGTSYQLENVEYTQETLEEKDCKHAGKSLIEIGDRNYCSTCGDFVNNPLNNK